MGVHRLNSDAPAAQLILTRETGEGDHPKGGGGGAALTPARDDPPRKTGEGTTRRVVEGAL